MPTKENKMKQADDLPNHAFQVMKQTLDMMGDVFPSIQRSDLQRTFVDCYFSEKEEKTFTCSVCKQEKPLDQKWCTFVDGSSACERCFEHSS